MSGSQRRTKGRKEPEYISAKLENINGKQEMMEIIRNTHATKASVRFLYYWLHNNVWTK